MKRELTLVVDGAQITVLVERIGDRIVVERDGERHEVVVAGDRYATGHEGASPPAGGVVERDGGASVVAASGPVAGSGSGGGATEHATGEVTAPMVGVVREIHAKAGATVAAGDLIITMEAMKMDIYVNAPVDGSVSSVLCSVGDTTTEGAVLATISPAGGAAEANAT